MDNKREFLTFVISEKNDEKPDVQTFWPHDEHKVSEAVHDLQAGNFHYEIIKVNIPDQLKTTAQALWAINELVALEAGNDRISALLGVIVLAVRKNIRQIK